MPDKRLKGKPKISNWTLYVGNNKNTKYNASLKFFQAKKPNKI